MTGLHSAMLLFTWIVFIVCAQFSDAEADEYKLLPQYDVCNPKVDIYNPPSVYIANPGDFTDVYFSWNFSKGESSDKSCQMLFKTCNWCRIKVDLVGPSFNFPKRTDLEDSTSCGTGSTYFLLHDGDYPNTSRAIANTSMDRDRGFQSLSAQLYVVACSRIIFKSDTEVNMQLRLTSVEKIEVITPDTAALSSPTFPSPYAKNNEKYTYKFNASSQFQFIAIIFNDWILSPYSEVMFSEANKVSRVYKNTLRPYVISDGPSMEMMFYTGEQTGPYSSSQGFRAVASFYSDRSEIPNYETNCDRVLSSSSDGGIAHLGTAADGKSRDCIWLIKKLSNFDGVYLRVIRFRSSWDIIGNDGVDYSLEVRKGIFSENNLLLSVVPTTAERSSPLYGAQLSNDGFYIRIKGRYNSDDSLVIAFAMYLNDCQDYGIYYKCDNGRCISERLKCDTYDHCGDSSDERSSLCGRVSSKISNLKPPSARGGPGYPSDGSSITTGGSNYSSSISISVIIPMVVSVFLVIVMCLIIIFVRRCRRLRNAAYGGQHPPGLIRPQSRGRRHRRRNRNVQMSVTVSSGEHPPTYDEVLQSTPIGYLNMAFSWSHAEPIPGLPPSYEEATAPTSQETTDAATTMTNNSSGEANTAQLRGGAILTTTALSASLDPQADVSSSSSSEDASYLNNHLDTSSSSSSDSACEHDNMLISHLAATTQLSRSNHNLTSDKEAHTRVSLAKPVSDYTETQVVLDSPSLAKVSTDERRGGQKEANYNSLSDLDRNQYITNNKISRRKDMDTGAGRNMGGHDGTRDGHDGRDAREERRTTNGERNGENVQNREGGFITNLNLRNPHFQEARDLYSSSAASQKLVQSPTVTPSSRSQSCADLLMDVSGGKLRALNSTNLSDEDKRFSYAGAGDVSLKRDNNFLGRGLFRDKGTEHLDKFASQSYDNLTSSCDTKNRCYGLQTDLHRPHSSVTSLARLPESSPPSMLAPVLESATDEVYEKTAAYEGAMRPGDSANTKDRTGHYRAAERSNDSRSIADLNASATNPASVRPKAAQRQLHPEARGPLPPKPPKRSQFTNQICLPQDPVCVAPGAQDQSTAANCSPNQRPNPKSDSERLASHFNRGIFKPAEEINSAYQSQSRNLPYAHDTRYHDSQSTAPSNTESNRHPPFSPKRNSTGISAKPSVQQPQKPTPAPRNSIRKKQKSARVLSVERADEPELHKRRDSSSRSGGEPALAQSQKWNYPGSQCPQPSPSTWQTNHKESQDLGNFARTRQDSHHSQLQGRGPSTSWQGNKTGRQEQGSLPKTAAHQSEGENSSQPVGSTSSEPTCQVLFPTISEDVFV